MIKTFVCAVCNQEFGKKDHLIDHMLEKHSREKEELSDEPMIKTLMEQFPNKVVKVERINVEYHQGSDAKYRIDLQYNDNAWIHQYFRESSKEDEEALDFDLDFGFDLPAGLENAIEALKDKVEMIEWIEKKAKEIGFEEFNLLRHSHGFTIHDEHYVFSGVVNGQEIGEDYIPYEDNCTYMSPKDFVAKLRHYFVDEVEGDVKWVIVDSFYEPKVDGIHVYDLLRNVKRVRIEILEREVNANA